MKMGGTRLGAQADTGCGRGSEIGSATITQLVHQAHWSIPLLHLNGHLGFNPPSLTLSCLVLSLACGKYPISQKLQTDFALS